MSIQPTRGTRVAADLDHLGLLRPDQVHQIYREIFHRDPPAGNTEHARRKIAWQVQAEQEGGLPESARQHALAIARNIPLRTRVASNAGRRSDGRPLMHTVLTHIDTDHDSRVPMPGNIIFKQHAGRSITVKVLDSGFEYEGRRYRSLSAIAHEITGTKWNGFVFFGLQKEAQSCLNRATHP